jgi:hypothetical protein
VRLRAPLDFDERIRETGTVTVLRNGTAEPLDVTEEGIDSEWLSAVIDDASGVTRVGYGHGFWQTAVDVVPSR